MKMNPRVNALKQLVSDEYYVIDEAAVAETMMLRSMALRMLPDVTFRAPRDVRRRCGPFGRIMGRGRFG